SHRNFSAAAIDFYATPATITGFVRTPAGNDVPFTFNKNSGTLAAGAAETVTVLQNYNYAARGFHIFNARTNLAGDTEPGNDSLRFSLNNSIAITKIPNTPVCPLSEVRLVRPTFLGSMQWNVNGVLSSVDTLVLRPVANTVVYLSGQDYRGCTLLDSAIVEVTGDGLPPRPVLQFGSHVLNHRNGFRDTVRVNSLPGHTVQWLGGFGTANTDTSYLLNQVAGMNGAKVAAAYTRTADGCSNLSDTITYSYGTGVLLDNTGALAVSDSSFYDSGGPVGNTGNSFTRTFTPAIPGTRMRLVLYRLDLAPFARLELYDGPTTSSPRIQFLDNTLNGNTTREFIASNESGALTVRFVPGSFASQGWWGGLTTHVPEVYRTVSNGFWINAATWERKAPNGNFQPATRPPLKGDDTVYVRHNVLVNTSIASDQVVVEESGHLRIESPTSNFISVAAYKTTPQPEFLVRGTLTTNAFAQLFGSNGFIEVKGTFANAGQIDLDSVYFTGTQPQTVGVAGSTGKMRYIRISNPAGLTVAGDQELIGITFDQGLINTSSAAMIQFTQKGDDFVVGAGTASHINGPARVGFFGDGQRFYPIGRGGVYRPVRHFCLAANSSDQFESITAEIVPGPPPSRSFPSGINAVSQVRHYRFLRTGNNGTSYRVVLPYGTDDGVTDPVNLTIARGEGAGAWEDITGTASGPAPGTIQSAAFSGFGDFVLANKTGGGNGLLTSVRSFNNQPFPGVQVYPNPVPEVLNLQLQQPQQYRQLAVRLLDLLGRELKRWNFFQPAGLLQLGVEGLPAGTYLLELRSGQQQHVEMLRKQ
ncbi:MAG TPA: T9SS type A sorting domain-containing protein, partial [Lacibacter sp.]|nr:T9SS type A sorting domain-containing protein [Lacibacter sp.]